MTKLNAQELSWGRCFDSPQNLCRFSWGKELLSFVKSNENVKLLSHGNGRSYGDVCLNSAGSLISTKNLNRLISFDSEKGILHCESGTSFEEILNFSVPRGWFLPVTPGTMLVTVGGAVGNDVHGKNHHIEGNFGHHVISIELVNSNGNVNICSEEENSDLFHATIGGIGLTGIILSCKFQLKKIVSPYIDQEIIKFNNIEDFFKIDEDSAENFEYTVSWIDSLAKGSQLARGLYIRGNHSLLPVTVDEMKFSKSSRGIIPFSAPTYLLNKFSVKCFNELYYHKQRSRHEKSRSGIQSFFYPLDMIEAWNKLYGKRGFRQFQFVLPSQEKELLIRILEEFARKGYSSFLTVLKKFGNLTSRGYMSFPIEGYTAAFDLPNKGNEVNEFLSSMTDKILANGGRIYLAKDSLLNPEQFRLSYPQWQKFSEYIDKSFHSDLWARVNNGI